MTTQPEIEQPKQTPPPIPEAGTILCHNTRTYQGPGGSVDIMTVLVAGDIGDYAAYIGHSLDTEWIFRHGDKLTFDEAAIHFPWGLKKENYRR